MNKIELENVTKRYGKTVALKDVSLSIDEGSIFGLLGTNGAGKSTLLKLLIQHIYPDKGRIKIGNTDIRKEGSKIRHKIGYMPELVDFPGLLTAKEILSFHAKMRNINDKDRRQKKIKNILDIVGLSSDSNRKVKEYSKGMKRRLGLATSIIGDVEVLLLDEPTSGLDPLGVTDFHNMILGIRKNTNITVLFSSHVLTEIEDICNDVVILHNGEIKRKGTISDLKKTIDDNVTIDIYLNDIEDTETVSDFLVDKTDIERLDDTHIRVKCSRSKVRGIYTDLPVEPEMFELAGPSLNEIFEKIIKNGN